MNTPHTTPEPTSRELEALRDIGWDGYCDPVEHLAAYRAGIRDLLANGPAADGEIERNNRS